MNKKCIINLFLSIFIFSCIFISGCSRNNIIMPNDIMKRALLDSNKYNTAYCEGLYTLSCQGVTMNFKIKNWVYNGGLNQRMDYIDLGKTKNDEIYLKSGNKYIDYMKKVNKAYISHNFSIDNYLDFRKDILENFAQMEEYYYISVLSTKKINGFSTYHIRLRNKRKLNFKYDIWVDKKSFFVVKEVSEQSNVREKIIYKKVTFSPKFPKNCFKLSLPKNVKRLNADNMREGQKVSISKASKVLGKHILNYSNESDKSKLYKLKSVNLAYIISKYAKEDPIIITQKYRLNNKYNNNSMFQIIVAKMQNGSEYYLAQLGFTPTKVRGQNAAYKNDSDSTIIYWVEDGLIYEMDSLDPHVGLDKLKQIANSLVK